MTKRCSFPLLYYQLQLLHDVEQERAAELAAHEESLETWKNQFKAEAIRQIAERERLLTEWQGRLERRQAELEDLQRSAEASQSLSVMCRNSSQSSYATYSMMFCVTPVDVFWSVMLHFGLILCRNEFRPEKMPR